MGAASGCRWSRGRDGCSRGRPQRARDLGRAADGEPVTGRGGTAGRSPLALVLGNEGAGVSAGDGAAADGGWPSRSRRAWNRSTSRWRPGSCSTRSRVTIDSAVHPTVLRRVRRPARRHRRQLPQRLHSAVGGRAEAVGDASAVALPALRARRSPGTTTSRWSPGCCSGPAAAAAGSRSPISIPSIELATGAHLGIHGLASRVGVEALRGAVFGTMLLGIAMTDARAYIIPDEFSLGGLVLGLLFSSWPDVEAFGTALLGAAVGFGLLWLVAVAGDLGLQAGCDGRRRHQDDGDGRRVRRVAGRPAHGVSGGADRQPHLRAAHPRRAQEAGALRDLSRPRCGGDLPGRSRDPRLVHRLLTGA